MTNPSAANANPGKLATRRLDAVEARLAALEEERMARCSRCGGEKLTEQPCPRCGGTRNVDERLGVLVPNPRQSVVPTARALARVQELLACIADPNSLSTGENYRAMAREALRLLGSTL